MAKKKDEMSVAAGQMTEAKKAEGDKKYARLPDKLVATLPAGIHPYGKRKGHGSLCQGQKAGPPGLRGDDGCPG